MIDITGAREELAGLMRGVLAPLKCPVISNLPPMITPPMCVLGPDDPWLTRLTHRDWQLAMRGYLVVAPAGTVNDSAIKRAERLVAAVLGTDQKLANLIRDVSVPDTTDIGGAQLYTVAIRFEIPLNSNYPGPGGTP